jgi:hypothetical protein
MQVSVPMGHRGTDGGGAAATREERQGHRTKQRTVGRRTYSTFNRQEWYVLNVIPFPLCLNFIGSLQFLQKVSILKPFLKVVLLRWFIA